MPAQRDFSIFRQKRLSMSAMRVCVPGAQKFFWRSNKFLFLSFGQGVYIFEESPKSIQYSIRDVYCPGTNCSNREKCESLGGYVTTSRLICGCGKWLFVHELPFMLQEHVKTTKNRQHTLFFAKKCELGTQQTIVTWCPISTNQIQKEKIVCGHQNTLDYWICVLSDM